MTGQHQAFIDFAIAQQVLSFGEFTLKSGRISPYFFNAGRFRTGAALAQLGRFYAQAISARGIDFDMLFGPAYKGIPLVTATAIALAERHGRDLPWCFNRKEAKDHGEGGQLVGAPLQGKVLIVDDVITAGTAVGESVALIRAAGAEPVAIVIALDRQERGAGAHSAVEEVEQRHGLQVVSLITLADLIQHVAAVDSELSMRMQDYRVRYGISRPA